MTFSALLIWTFGGHYHENQAIPPDQDGAALVDMSTEHAIRNGLTIEAILVEIHVDIPPRRGKKHAEKLMHFCSVSLITFAVDIQIMCLVARFVAQDICEGLT